MFHLGGGSRERLLHAVQVRVYLHKSHGEVIRGFEDQKDGLIMADIYLYQIVPSTLYWYSEVWSDLILLVLTPIQVVSSL